MRLADSHCHLTMDAFAGDRAEVVERAAGLGVEVFINVPARRGDAAACAALAASAPRIYATAGLHPHEARLWDAGAEGELRTALASPRVVAIGEIGLDYHYDLSPHEDQARAFRSQIAIAREARRPIIVHTRSAPAETLAILREENARDVGGVIHCFTENTRTAMEMLDLGFYISFSGIVTFPKATEIQAAARAIPQDRLLVETDAPYLAPVPHRGRRSEPGHVAATLSFVARLRDEDPEDLAASTLANCLRAFRLDLAG